MKRQPSLIAVLLFITGLLCIGSLFFFGYNTYRQIMNTENDLEAAMEQIEQKQQEIKENEEFYTSAVQEKQTALERQKAQASQKQQTRERAPGAEDADASKPSVFSQESQEEGNSVFSSGENTASGGHVIGIDPGHQGYHVDMSDLEPLGPGSSEMKAKATTGTQGAYTGVPEYQLNLDISLKLKSVLEQRGYQVVLTRTDNDTAISNKERAEYAAAQGAEIYVRIHANGDDSHTASGALTMAPSPENPYIPQLSEESTRLSQCILDSYCAVTGFQNLGVQYYDNMTGINWSTVPVTILEMGFMTNQYDDTQMNDSDFQNVMVDGIANGIDAYFG
ncbi:MAG: N-acetylmuramoyl-L-alanine amidase [Eubacteriales bacterium]|nr:N-acetylmuramoyl-L-alanine amidase [Eubacteriales bacterium]